jgi:Fe-S-cluster-containing dehydrogenase component
MGRSPALRKSSKALLEKHWAMVIDTRKLQHEEDIEPLIEVCHAIHNVPHFENKNHEIKWIWETHYHNAFPAQMPTHTSRKRFDHRPFLVLCNHCQKPPMRAGLPDPCDLQAGKRRHRTDGFPPLHRLPFLHGGLPLRLPQLQLPGSAAPLLKSRTKHSPTRMMGVVEKCNFCAERLAVGEQPACVEASNGAIVFGDLYDPESEMRDVLRHNYTIRRKQNLGTEPSRLLHRVRYICLN